ncbi:MAG: hydrogenase expression/formation protein HypE [Pirellulales bacterium]|nr:hydrogenase expression/formation protein HypE [Pirellulales bacterium]
MPAPNCPLPLFADGPRISLAHGEGARLTRQLIAEIVRPLANPALQPLGDAASLASNTTQLSFTTDSFVVAPRFFPGGDIGTLSVIGTVNDLAVAGARPRWLSLGLIVEEGLLLAELHEIVGLIGAAANAAGVAIVTGDTKVVERGAVDGLFINTAGVGETVLPAPPGAQHLMAGDVLLVSGPIGSHGIAVLVAREQLGLEPAPHSDCASLLPAVAALRASGIVPRAMRDATRGGVAAVLHEWAAASGQTLAIDENQVPVNAQVRGAAELLGLDPLQIACEGAMVVAVAPGDAARALAALRATDVAAGAALVGEVRPRGPVPVVIRRATGMELALDEPWGAPLPRIC